MPLRHDADPAVEILRLRDDHATCTSGITNSRDARAKNQRIIDETLREAELLRAKTVQMGQFWKHNAELHAEERRLSHSADAKLRQQHDDCDAMVKSLHSLLDVVSRELNHLAQSEPNLESAVAQYRAMCTSQLKETELLQDRVATLKRARGDINERMANAVTETREQCERLEQEILQVDQEIAAEEMENVRLKLDLGLRGRR